MSKVLLIDFGSTFTKVTAVDPDERKIEGTAQSFTTVHSGIQNGLEAALLQLGADYSDFAHVFACSSAAGGLRMAVSGLIPDLTAKAAQLAALGAGAKVVRCFHHELTEEDLQTLEESAPDILLLCGGTDGGNRKCVEGNAEKLSALSVRFPIIYAGNRSARDRCKTLLKDRDVTWCPNVMPRLGELHVKPVQDAIRELFLDRIVESKGMSDVQNLLDHIVMPTPAAVLSALRLLSLGTRKTKGIGELIAIDLGGATTDVYSMASGHPVDDNVLYKGLQEPFEKRTVEGDIGMRYSLSGIVEASGLSRIEEKSGLSQKRILSLISELEADKSFLPKSGESRQLDFALAGEALRIAIERHVGRWEEAYTPHGRQYLQTGKDLRNVRQLILTGGALLHAGPVGEFVRECLYDETKPFLLKPKHVNIRKDQQYILSAMGLLAKHDEEAALHIMKKEIISVGDSK